MSRTYTIAALFLCLGLISCGHDGAPRGYSPVTAKTTQNKAETQSRPQLKSQPQIKSAKVKKDEDIKNTHLQSLYGVPKSFPYNPTGKRIGVVGGHLLRGAENNNMPSSCKGKFIKNDFCTSVKKLVHKEKSLWQDYAADASFQSLKLINNRDMKLYSGQSWDGFASMYTSLQKLSDVEKLDYLILYDIDFNNSLDPTLYNKALDKTLGPALDTPTLSGLLFIPAVSFVMATSFIPIQKISTHGYARFYLIDLKASVYNVFEIDPKTVAQYRSLMSGAMGRERNHKDIQDEIYLKVLEKGIEGLKQIKSN